MDAKFVPSSSSLDPNALSSLRSKARAHDPKAIQAAAKQFESLFLNQLLKSMRDAQKGDGEGIFDSNESRMYTGLLDEQLANRIANGPGIGMADMVLAQIDRSRSMAKAAEQAAGGTQATGEIKNGQAMPIIRQGDRNVR
ncbi:MAG: rod-binding protein [Pseudomonadota bacterium]